MAFETEDPQVKTHIIAITNPHEVEHAQVVPAAEPPTDGLIAHYTMDEIVGTILFDDTDNSYDGTLINGVTQVEGHLGQALDFVRASNQYISCGTGMADALGNGVSALAVSFWFKADIVSAAIGLFNIGSHTNLGEFTLNIHPGNKLRFRLNSGVFVGEIDFSDTVDWHHLFLQYTGSAGQLYLDNVKVIDAAHSTDLDLSGLKTLIGSYFSPTSAFAFDGKIDQIWIYDRELSPGEIGLLYSAISYTHVQINTHINNITNDPHETANDILTLTNKTLDGQGTGNIVKNVNSLAETNAQDEIKVKRINIEDWDMNVSVGGSATKAVAHGLTLANIRGITVEIVNDAGSASYDNGTPSSGGTEVDFWIESRDASNINLKIRTGGQFDNADFDDDSSYIRGYIMIWYKV